MQVSWSEALETGHEIIDQDHKLLLTCINALYHTVSRDEGIKDITNQFLLLDSYTGMHFQREENLMRQINYAHSADHIFAHDDFIEKISTFYKTCGVTSLQEINDLIEYLMNWLIHHIGIEDKALVKALANAEAEIQVAHAS